SQGHSRHGRSKRTHRRRLGNGVLHAQIHQDKRLGRAVPRSCRQERRRCAQVPHSRPLVVELAQASAGASVFLVLTKGIRRGCPKAASKLLTGPAVPSRSPIAVVAYGFRAGSLTEYHAGMDPAPRDLPQCWPALPLASWKDTCATLHMWTQIVGKIRLALTPRLNHWWNVPFYVTPRGLTTSQMPYGDRSLELRFDFLAHQLVLQGSDGVQKSLPLAARSVADFDRECRALLADAGAAV